MKTTFISTLALLTAVSPAYADDAVTLATPGMFGPLAANAKPMHFDAGEEIGDIYVTGAASGLGLWQNHELATDDGSLADIDNAHIVIQKPTGLFQFYAQAGAYSLPSVGSAYVRTSDAVDAFFGLLPVAYVKMAPTDNFSIQAGKLYTLIGTENTFTFQNANIERGLLWNQTNAVNRGVQANYSQGAFSGSLAWSDGFYSGEYNWLSGLATYAFDANNSLTLIASGSLKEDSKSTLATPLAQNNSQIYDLSYTYITGPWTLMPTLQYTHVPERASVGIADDASTYGAGLTTKYKIDDHWNIAGRAEYITSDGSATSPNLLYGTDSNAWSLTITPTYQQGVFFVRGEASYVKANDVAAGAGFGSAGNDDSQARLLVETGILF